MSGRLNNISIYRNITVGNLIDQFAVQGIDAALYVKSQNNRRCDDMTQVIDIDKEIVIRPDQYRIGAIIICELLDINKE